MPKLFKLLHDATNLLQAIAGNIELAKDAEDELVVVLGVEARLPGTTSITSLLSGFPAESRTKRPCYTEYPPQCATRSSVCSSIFQSLPRIERIPVRISFRPRQNRRQVLARLSHNNSRFGSL